MFRFKKSVNLPYNRQGYIYFYSRLYRTLPPKEQKYIEELCTASGGEYSAALFKFVTTDASATALGIEYNCDRSTIYRCVKKYYENFKK